MARRGHKRSPMPSLEEQKKIYLYWLEHHPTTQQVAEHYGLGTATIQRIITKGLLNKWHNP